MPISPEELHAVRVLLAQIYESARAAAPAHESNRKVWDQMARDLSACIGLEKPWGYRYPLAVFTGSLTTPSPQFVRAVNVLGAVKDDVPVLIADAVSVSVLAGNGQIDPGSYVMGSSRLCFNPLCSIRFVPNTPSRKYCPVCRPQKKRSRNGHVG